MWRGLVLGLLLIAPAPASAWRIASEWQTPRRGDIQTRMFTIRNEYGLRPRTLRRIERAIVIQSRQLHRYWRTPIARFGSGGIPVVMKEGNEVIAGHGLARGRPRILISVQPMPFIGNRFWDADWWSLSLSHEILETLADPRQTGREVCDPVNNLAYRIRGVWVSDFVLPNGRGFLRR